MRKMYVLSGFDAKHFIWSIFRKDPNANMQEFFSKTKYYTMYIEDFYCISVNIPKAKASHHSTVHKIHIELRKFLVLSSFTFCII